MAPALTVAASAVLGAACGPRVRVVVARHCGPGGSASSAPGVVEAATAGVYAVLAARTGSSLPLLAVLCWCAAAGVALAVIDARVRRLPDAVVGTGLAGVLAGLAAVAALDGRPAAFGRSVLAGAALFGCYVLVHLAGRSALGFGDCKLAALLGTVLGWFGWPAVLAGTLVAFVLGGTWGCALLVTGRGRGTDTVPFGPFMLAGALVAVLAGS